MTLRTLPTDEPVAYRVVSTFENGIVLREGLFATPESAHSAAAERRSRSWVADARVESIRAAAWEEVPVK